MASTTQEANRPRRPGLLIGIVSILVFSQSCTTTLNHGTTLPQGTSELSLRSPLTVGGNRIDFRYGLTDELTMGLAAKGLLFPGGEVYGILGMKSDGLDTALSAGVILDPEGYDRTGERRSFGRWISPSVSLAASRALGSFRPFANVYADSWRGGFEAGTEWTGGGITWSLSATGSYYYHDYGPVDYNNSGIVFSFPRGRTVLGIVPGVSWTF